ncbi:Tryprostatin B 6-hydroxylase [Cladobotryum mycophilum]|uniref:Tryprostatin B 6-hydroxylase n=1 Tax=Cladobotryum mycophilum TaxID=491253 RepID=A0ABR0SKK1_9HYPO
MDAFYLYHHHQHALLIGLGLLSGVLIHTGLFIKGEWHTQAPQIFLLHVALFVVFPILSRFLQDYYVGSILCSVSYWSYGYLPGLLASTILYRTVFHPLTRAGFRGPWYARVSKIWHVWACRDSRNHLVLESIHRKYGDFVRTGPSEVTVYHPDVFMALDGPRSECIKAEWYDVLHPTLSLVTTRNKAIHTARRREWNTGLTSKAVAEHEAKAQKYVSLLDDCIENDAKANQITDMRNLLFWFSFDVMGDFVLSKSFDMLQNRQWHHIIVRLQRALSLLGPLGPAPWLLQVGLRLGPRIGIVKDWFDILAWCKLQMTARLQNGNTNQSQDLTFYLMEKETKENDHDRQDWVQGDSLLAIVAGSDPTAFSLVAAFCELAKHPEHVEQIYAEVRDVDITDIKILTKLPHLNAVIKEALRLHPAVPTGGNRKTTQNGIMIGDQFIPPNTTVVAPRYIIKRREDCFERATEFIPERWTTRPEMVRNLAAYKPFGTGNHNCLGRAFATDNMRYVTARLLKKYRFRAAPGDQSLSAMETVTDQFISNPGALDLCFELREDALL